MAGIDVDRAWLLGTKSPEGEIGIDVKDGMVVLSLTKAGTRMSVRFAAEEADMHAILLVRAAFAAVAARQLGRA